MKATNTHPLAFVGDLSKFVENNLSREARITCLVSIARSTFKVPTVQTDAVEELALVWNMLALQTVVIHLIGPVLLTPVPTDSKLTTVYGRCAAWIFISP